MKAWEKERKQRILFEKRPSIKAFDIIVKEFKNNGTVKIKNLSIEYFEVDHKPVKYAYGFNFYSSNKKITISGDTKPCNNLIKYSQNTDILLHEVFIEGELKATSMRTNKTLHNVKSYHTSSKDVGKIAKICNAKKLVLTHFVPTQFNEKKLKNLVKKDFRNTLIIGKDLLKISV